MANMEFFQRCLADIEKLDVPEEEKEERRARARMACIASRYHGNALVPGEPYYDLLTYGEDPASAARIALSYTSALFIRGLLRELGCQATFLCPPVDEKRLGHQLVLFACHHGAWVAPRGMVILPQRGDVVLVGPHVEESWRVVMQITEPGESGTDRGSVACCFLTTRGDGIVNVLSGDLQLVGPTIGVGTECFPSDESVRRHGIENPLLVRGWIDVGKLQFPRDDYPGANGA